MEVGPCILSEIVCNRAESFVHLSRGLYASLYYWFRKLDKLSDLVRRCALVLPVGQFTVENVLIS